MGLPVGPIGDSTPHSLSDADPTGRKDRVDMNEIYLALSPKRCRVGSTHV